RPRIKPLAASLRVPRRAFFIRIVFSVSAQQLTATKRRPSRAAASAHSYLTRDLHREGGREKERPRIAEPPVLLSYAPLLRHCFTSSDVEVFHIESVVFDEAAARFDRIAHQDGEH